MTMPSLKVSSAPSKQNVSPTSLPHTPPPAPRSLNTLRFGTIANAYIPPLAISALSILNSNTDINCVHQTGATSLRREMTPAEKLLWQQVRANKLGVHFRRHTCPDGRCQGQIVAGFIVDFCCLSAGLGVEADGGQHYDEEAKRYDERRSAELLKKGIRVIRFSDYDILRDPEAVQRTIYRELTGEVAP